METSKSKLASWSTIEYVHQHCYRAFNFGEFIKGKAQQPLPSPIAPDEPRFSAFADSCHALCNKLLYLLGLGLGVGPFTRCILSSLSYILRFAISSPPPTQHPRVPRAPSSASSATPQTRQPLTQPTTFAPAPILTTAPLPSSSASRAKPVWKSSKRATPGPLFPSAPLVPRTTRARPF